MYEQNTSRLPLLFLQYVHTFSHYAKSSFQSFFSDVQKHMQKKVPNKNMTTKKGMTSLSVL